MDQKKIASTWSCPLCLAQGFASCSAQGSRAEVQPKSGYQAWCVFLQGDAMQKHLVTDKAGLGSQIGIITVRCNTLF